MIVAVTVGMECPRPHAEHQRVGRPAPPAKEEIVDERLKAVLLNMPLWLVTVVLLLVVVLKLEERPTIGRFQPVFGTYSYALDTTTERLCLSTPGATPEGNYLPLGDLR